MSDHPLYNLVFSHAAKAVYAPVPKAACTSFKAYLRQIEGLRPAAAELVHSKSRNGLTYADSIDRVALLNILFSKVGGYYKFTVVRNPFHRLVSAYRDLLAPREDGKPRYQAEAESLLALVRTRLDARPSECPHLTFETFVETLPSLSPLKMDRHWAPQNFLTMSQLLTWDLVIRFEEMNDRLPELAEKLNAPLMNLHLNKSGDDIVLTDWYTPRLEKIVTEIYAADFRRFRYHPTIKQPAPVRRAPVRAHARAATTVPDSAPEA